MWVHTGQRGENHHSWSTHVTKNWSAARNQSESRSRDCKSLEFRRTWDGVQVHFPNISKYNVWKCDPGNNQLTHLSAFQAFMDQLLKNQHGTRCKELGKYREMKQSLPPLPSSRRESKCHQLDNSSILALAQSFHWFVISVTFQGDPGAMSRSGWEQEL